MYFDWNYGPYLEIGKFSIWWTYKDGIFYEPNCHFTGCCYLFIDILGLKIQIVRS
jgi:hypothetical protein